MENEKVNFLIYSTPNSDVRVDVFLQDETIWLTQKAMGELFGVVKSTISEHLSNIFETNELSPIQPFGISEQFSKKVDG